MPHISEDRVLETCTANTTVSFTTTGAVTGFRTFASQLSVGDTCYYSAQQVDASGTPTGAWENGLGTYSAANTLTRTTVLESSNANTAVTFGAGTIQLAIGLLAMRNVHYDNNLSVWLQGATAEPPTPPADNMYLYARTILPGHTVLKTKRPSGVDSPIQDAVAFNRILKFIPTSGTAPGLTSAPPALASAGTITIGNITPTTALGNAVRANYTSTTTAGNVTGVWQTGTSNTVTRATGNGLGGFRYVVRFGLVSLQSGNRGYFGLTDSNTAGSNIDPLTSTTPGKLGVGFNANTGNLRLINNVTGTAPTTLDLGANFVLSTTSLYELVLFCRPGNGTTAGDISYRVRVYGSNGDNPVQEVSGTLTTNIPAASTILYPTMWMTNNATAAAVAFTTHGFAIESDY